MRSLVPWLAAAFLATSAASAAEPVVIGYLPAFRGLDAVLERADFRHYTHVDIAFVNPGSSGEMVAANGELACAPTISDAGLRKTVAKAHVAKAKILASLGGGTIPPCAGD